jgi:hypothetical protein
LWRALLGGFVSPIFPDSKLPPSALLWRNKVKNSLNKTARWSTLALAMGFLGAVSVQSEAAINWPGGTGDTTTPSKSYKKGYKDGTNDCISKPKDCGVLLEDVVANPGWGEVEPNDHQSNATRLRLNRFYKGNSLDANDQDWYYVGATKPNQNLVISFLGDQANYTDTAGWIIQVRDKFGNILSSFDSTTSGPGNVYRNGDSPSDIVDPNEPVLAKTPLSDAKIILATLGNAGRYYVTVSPNANADGTQRAYHIAAMFSASDQLSPNPDTNFYNTETEDNDSFEQADLIQSNVHTFGVFGREIIKFFIPPAPAQYETKFFYQQCNELDPLTIPGGLANCECDIGNNPVTPDNPNIDTAPTLPGIQPGPLQPSDACESRVVQVPGTGTDSGQWVAAFDYDNDWFYYQSPGNEELRFELCKKETCSFNRVHLRVTYVNDSTVIINTPIKPGDTFDFGVAKKGAYYIELSPEPVDGPVVDPETGFHTVDDLTGPYNFILMGTKLPTNGS